MKRAILACLTLIFSHSVGAQLDSLQTSRDTSDVNKSGIGTIFQGNPGKAALYSLLLPGAGQIYNRRYWKLPLVYALEGTTIYFVIKNTRQYQRFNRCYRSIVNENISNDDCGRITSVTDAFNTRNSAKTNQEYAWLALIAGHLFQTLEAYIDRHLIDFDVDDDLTIGHEFNNSVHPEIKIVSLKFPINKPKPSRVPMSLGLE